MIELVLVRHGQPDWEPDGLAVENPSLTVHGRQQAERVAETLCGERFDAICVSPLVRARQTAEPIGRLLGIEPTIESWLEELRLPPMEGMTGEEVARFFRSANSRELGKWWDGMPGGESFRHFYGRIAAGAEDWLDESHGALIHRESAHRLWHAPEGDKRILIVGHEGTNAVLISHLLGTEPVPWAWLRFSSAWCGITRLVTTAVAGGSVWVLTAFNQIGHMLGLPDPGGGVSRPDLLPRDPELALNPRR